MRYIQKVIAAGVSLAMATTMCVAVPATGAIAAETGTTDTTATEDETSELIDINEAIKSSFSIPDVFYTGSPVEPCGSVAFKYSNTGAKLTAGKDYTVTYENNVNKGTATATLTGIEEAGLTGTKTVTFNIIEFSYTISLNGVKKMTFDWDQLKRLAATSVDNAEPAAFQYGTTIVYSAPKQYVTFDTLASAAGVSKWDYAEVAATDGFASTVNASINTEGKWWPSQTTSGYATAGGEAVPAVIAISYATANIESTAAAAAAEIAADYDKLKAEDTKVLVGATEADYVAGELAGSRFATSVCTMNFVVLKTNTLSVTPTSKTVKNNKKQKIQITTKKAQGTVTYAVKSAASKKAITVSKKGVVTIAKGAKTGKYVISVTAAGNKNYKAKTKTVTIKVTK
ncbi:MAG: hypothetical protein ACI4OC_02760 [Coriobacteriales bacterium]